METAMIQRAIEQEGLSLSDEQLCQLKEYAEYLVSYNEHVNLTAITNDEGIAVKHFLDSLLLTKYVDIPPEAKVIDVGTGAGFPLVPVKIWRKDIKGTLLDSLNKRVVFLTTLCEKLQLSGIQAVHFRAEEAGQKKEYREQYDIATARAVAHLRELAEYCLPFVRVGGVFVAMKGFEIEKELSEAENAISLLGGKVVKLVKYNLPDEEKSGRSLVIIKKISQTSTLYPRPSAKIAKKPLE